MNTDYKDLPSPFLLYMAKQIRLKIYISLPDRRTMKYLKPNRLFGSPCGARKKKCKFSREKCDKMCEKVKKNPERIRPHVRPCVCVYAINNAAARWQKMSSSRIRNQRTLCVPTFLAISSRFFLLLKILCVCVCVCMFSPLFVFQWVIKWRLFK